MKTSGNTILITGGATGIGLGLAEAFHALGNQVIIAGRRAAALSKAADAHSGMAWFTVDMADKASIEAFAHQVIERFPDLNAVINNAGIMVAEDAVAGGYLDTAEAIVATNLLGPIRLTSALLPHLMTKPDAAVLTVSSGLAFVPLAITPTYSATKAAIHSYSMSLRHQLKGAGVQVIEIAPPWVQTELMGPEQAVNPNAMPLADFIAETMAILKAQPDAHEVIVERCRPLRLAEREGRTDQMFAMLNSQHG